MLDDLLQADDLHTIFSDQPSFYKLWAHMILLELHTSLYPAFTLYQDGKQTFDLQARYYVIVWSYCVAGCVCNADCISVCLRLHH